MSDGPAFETPFRHRDQKIETLRGLACLLLVAFHVVGDTPYSGLHVEQGWMRHGSDALSYLRMPLFTFISGFVYAWRPVVGATGPFLLGKLRRLLVPMLTVGLLFAATQWWMPGANHGVPPRDWIRLLLAPTNQYWYLESLLLIFVLVALLDRTRRLATPVGWALAWVAAACASLSGVGTVWLSIEGALYLLPYFLLGLGLSRFAGQRLGRWPGAAALALALLLTGVWCSDRVASHQDRSLDALVIGSLGCLLLWMCQRESRGLAWIGHHSYAIFLFHVFFTAAARMALSRLGVESAGTQLLAGTVAGLLGPSMIDRLLSRHPLPRWLLLGRRFTAPSTSPGDPRGAEAERAAPW